MPRIRNAERRKKIIDQLLNSRTKIWNRDIFLKLVNERLDEGEISQSTLDKDIALINAEIQDLGVSIKWDHSKGFHYTLEGFSMFKKAVDEQDKNLLFLATSVFSLFQGTPLQEKFSKLVNKLLAEGSLGGKVLGLSELQLIQLGEGPAVKGSQWIPQILDAIQHKEPLKMFYQGVGKPEKQKHICPYLIKKYMNRWFMVAYDHNCERPQKTSVFALDRIKGLDVSNKTYTIDPTFSPEDYFRYSIGVWHFHEKEPIQVKLEFTDFMEQVMSIPIHHSQKTKLSPDRQKLEVEIEVYNSPELEMLIRSFGSGVRVVSPASLAERIKAQAVQTVDIYS
jgi:predicted DNA-binding transcriptional regulator YafY